MQGARSQADVLQEIEQRLTSGGVSQANLQAILDRVLAHVEGNVGTIHRWDASSAMLQLETQRGVPDQLLPKITAIPQGKGMAGLAAERREPVQVCDLQTDCSGVARPAARETGAQGSIAVPMLVSGQVRGVLGVAKTAAHDFEETEVRLLQQIAGRIGEAFGP